MPSKWGRPCDARTRRWSSLCPQMVQWGPRIWCSSRSSDSAWPTRAVERSEHDSRSTGRPSIVSCRSSCTQTDWWGPARISGRKSRRTCSEWDGCGGHNVWPWPRWCSAGSAEPARDRHGFEWALNRTWRNRLPECCRPERPYPLLLQGATLRPWCSAQPSQGTYNVGGINIRLEY